MAKLEKYTGEKTYMFPTGTLATPDVVYAKYPAAKSFTFVVGTDPQGQVMQSMNNLSVLRGVYNIDANLTEDEAIAAIEEILNTPVEVVDEPSAEERIAAALEYQVMASLPDEEVTDEGDTTTTDTESEVV